MLFGVCVFFLAFKFIHNYDILISCFKLSKRKNILLKLAYLFLIPVKKFFSMGIGKQVTMAILFGSIFGVFLRFFDTGINPESFKILGDIFLNLVKMTIVPLVFAAISSAILSMSDMKSLGKTAIQGVKLFMFTNIMGVIIGISAALIISPGLGSNIDTSKLKMTTSLNKFIHSGQGQAITNSSISDKLINIIPDNVFKAMYNADLLQIMFFTIIFSISVSMVKNKISNGIVSCIQNLAQVMYAMVKIVMKFAPFGIFGLITWITGVQEISVILALLKLVFCSVFAIFLLVFVFYPSLLWIRFRVNPLIFIKKMISVQIFALATGSSAATLPMNMKNAEEKLGATKESANLLMPIGTSLDMNGNACVLALYSVFVAQLFGIDVSISGYFTIGLICFLSSLGSPPIPGGAVIILSGVLASLHYPLEALSLIFAIDKIIGPLRTAGNVTGEAFAPLYLDILNKKWDKKKYYQK